MECLISIPGQIYVTGGCNIGSADGDARDDADDGDDDRNDGDDDDDDSSFGDYGVCNAFAAVEDVKIVDVDSDAIMHAPRMGIGRFGHATAASATSIFVFGGANATGLLSSCEEFNPQTMR